MSVNLMQKRSSYAEITLLLNYSHRLYNEYLNADKKFIYASILRKVNGRLYERLHECVSFFKEKSHADILELMLHLDVWMTIWDYEFKMQNPSLQDAFTFHNDVNFPGDSVTKLLLELAEYSD
jgi:hypothetical protein